jgi:hypothetical protein
VKLHVDLETLQLIEGPGFRNPVGSLRFKRGDAARLEVLFLRNGSTAATIGDPQQLELQFGVKPRGRYEAGYLTYTADWTMPPLGAEKPVYQCSPSFNTADLDAALDVGSATELPEITLMGEITWREGTGEPTSTRTFAVVVENDVNRGTEGTPFTLPGPDDYVAARAVLHDRLQTLDSAAQARARANIGIEDAGGATIADGSITLPKLADLPANTVIGRLAGVGPAQTLTHSTSATADTLARRDGAGQLWSNVFVSSAGGGSGLLAGVSWEGLFFSYGLTGAQVLVGGDGSNISAGRAINFPDRSGTFAVLDEWNTLSMDGIYATDGYFDTVNIATNLTVEGSIQAPYQDLSTDASVVTRRLRLEEALWELHAMRTPAVVPAGNSAGAGSAFGGGGEWTGTSGTAAGGWARIPILRSIHTFPGVSGANIRCDRDLTLSTVSTHLLFDGVRSRLIVGDAGSGAPPAAAANALTGKGWGYEIRLSSGNVEIRLVAFDTAFAASAWHSLGAYSINIAYSLILRKVGGTLQLFAAIGNNLAMRPAPIYAPTIALTTQIPVAGFTASPWISALIVNDATTAPAGGNAGFRYIPAMPIHSPP